MIFSLVYASVCWIKLWPQESFILGIQLNGKLEDRLTIMESHRVLTIIA